jgi:hypothetical protein
VGTEAKGMGRPFDELNLWRTVQIILTCRNLGDSLGLNSHYSRALNRRAPTLKRSESKGAGQRLYELACQLDLEGIVAKRADSPYSEDAGTSQSKR